MRFTRYVAFPAGALLLLAGACGGDKATGPAVVTLESVAVSASSIALQAGQKQTITATAIGTGNVNLADATFAFTSGNSAVAVVSSAGAITALSSGTTTVTVTGSRDGVNRTANVTVTVTGNLPTALTVVSGAASNDFAPPTATVARGAVVTWTFTARTHNVVFQGTAAGTPANIPDTGNQVAGVSRTFTTPGTFDYVCSRHVGMNATIVVP